LASLLADNVEPHENNYFLNPTKGGKKSSGKVNSDSESYGTSFFRKSPLHKATSPKAPTATTIGVGNFGHLTSADMSRIEEERMQVLAVSERDMDLRLTAARGQPVQGSRIRSRSKAKGATAALEGFDYIPPRSLEVSNITESTAKKKTSEKDGLTVVFPAPSLSSKPPPPISSPKKGPMRQPHSKKLSTGSDSSFSSGNSNPQKGKNRNNSSPINGFDVDPHLRQKQEQSNASRTSNNIEVHYNAWTASFDQLSTHYGASSVTSSSMNTADDTSSSTLSPHLSDSKKIRSVSENRKRNGHTSLPTNDADEPLNSESRILTNGRQSAPLPNDTVSSETSEGPRQKLRVHMALNEDLTCSYKQSKMHSSSIEGLVQVEIKSGSSMDIPFCLVVKDPLRHIKTIQESKTFAKDGPQDSRKGHYAYNVAIPKVDQYFPVIKYKCTHELCPVPIRVQTRVRFHKSFCRVALQISSNPANQGALADLTIFMTVPPSLRGETVTTAPAGGVWDSAKHGVLWCVAELGAGEKFQLQAQFEISDENLGVESQKPDFPVLVRCHCMNTQLSQIELDVSCIEDSIQPDVTIKLTRRFRLSHREKA